MISPERISSGFFLSHIVQNMDVFKVHLVKTEICVEFAGEFKIESKSACDLSFFSVVAEETLAGKLTQSSRK